MQPQPTQQSPPSPPKHGPGRPSGGQLPFAFSYANRFSTSLSYGRVAAKHGGFRPPRAVGKLAPAFGALGAFDAPSPPAEACIARHFTAEYDRTHGALLLARLGFEARAGGGPGAEPGCALDQPQGGRRSHSDAASCTALQWPALTKTFGRHLVHCATVVTTPSQNTRGGA